MKQLALFTLLSILTSLAADPALAKDSTTQAFKNAARPPEPLSPTEAEGSFRIRDGFVIELVAAEPLVTDPVNFAWGPDGKFWVVEMADYPLGLDDQGEPGGRVRFLEDRDGDGRYDTSTVFAEGIGFPTGVFPWREGVLISAAPAIYFAEDVDGDGRADLMKELYTGFREGNQQHRVNGFVWGLDGWVYIANGDSGGAVRSVTTGQETGIGGRDLRLQPDTGVFDLQTGMTQFGRSRNDWGDWFGCSNSRPLFHFALADHYIRRNPHAAPEVKATVTLAESSTSEIFPISRVLSHWAGYKPPAPGDSHRFTSACGTNVYRDELFGPDYSSDTFTSEPVHNLIHHRALEPRGVTFESKAVESDLERSGTKEFLASTDSWFRPTALHTGPDGSLWVADFYRVVLEHPTWIDDAVEKTLDLRQGHDRGRIWRIYPRGKTPRPIRRLDTLDGPALATTLDSPNAWQRDMSQMLLTWRKDQSARPALEKLASTGSPRVKVQALSTLDTLDALEDGILLRALSDTHPAVRRHAVRLSEKRFDASDRLGPALASLAEDRDPGVLLQLGYTLGEWKDSRAGVVLGDFLVRHSGDAYLRAAAISSLNAVNVDAAVLAVLASEDAVEGGLLGPLLATSMAIGSAELRARVLAAVTAPDKDGYAHWKLDVLAKMLERLATEKASLKAFRAGLENEWAGGVRAIERMLTFARKLALDPDASEEARVTALAVLGLGFDRRQEDIEILGEILEPAHSVKLQRAAVAQLSRLGDAPVPAVLTASWEAHAPKLRRTILDALLSREPWQEALLSFVEEGRIVPSDIDATRRGQLLMHSDSKLRKRAETALASNVDPDRKKRVAEFESLLDKPGDLHRGRVIFNQKCSVCHRVGEVGQQVGPDILAIKDRSPGAVLVALLDPNRAVEEKFKGYVAITRDGQSLTGILAKESSNSIRLRAQEGKDHEILRRDLTLLRATGLSLMPEGLEKDLSREDIANVIAFVGSVGKKPKRVKGNRPELVLPTDDGSLELLASNGEIYGKKIAVYEPQRCIGWWMQPDDHVIWSVDAPRAGRYEVELEWAIPDKWAGNRFTIMTSSGKELAGAIPSTGSFKDYEKKVFGTIELDPGYQLVTMRASGEVNGELADLRAVVMRPVTGE